MTKYVNCTRVTITVPGFGTFPPSGNIAHCETIRETLTAAGVVPSISRQKLGKVIGLPEPANSTMYIVSNMCLQALAGSRLDVVAPDGGGGKARGNSNRPVTLVVPGFLVY